ncbi:MAG: amidohydrolase family protein [Bacteroidia bacterium]|nr:amidohydrolase family protein [Bacteroidia bacterium]
MRFFAADKIHNGYSFLPQDSVLILDDDGIVQDIKPLGEIDQTKIEFHKGIVCPGFVNVHCHLELSYMKGKIAEGKGLHDFIKEVEKLKKPADDELLSAIENADAEMYAGGIVAVGDICNTNSTFAFKQRSKIKYHNFIEIFGFDAAKADSAFGWGLKLAAELEVLGLKNYSITPHAPYSASAQLLNKISDHAWQTNSYSVFITRKTKMRIYCFRIKAEKF